MSKLGLTAEKSDIECNISPEILGSIANGVGSTDNVFVPTLIPTVVLCDRAKAFLIVFLGESWTQC